MKYFSIQRSIILQKSSSFFLDIDEIQILYSNEFMVMREKPFVEH